MASSAIQNIPVQGSAHIQALQKIHHKPAQDDASQGETFADLVAGADTAQPQKPSAPRDKAAKAATPAAAPSHSDVKDVPDEEAGDIAAPDTKAAAAQPAAPEAEPAAEKDLAANDNDTPVEVPLQAAPAPQTPLKLAQAATAPQGENTDGDKAAIQPAARKPANDAAAAEAAAETPVDTAAEGQAAEFDQALRDTRPDAPARAPADATPAKGGDAKPSADLNTITLQANVAAPQPHAPQTVEKVAHAAQSAPQETLTPHATPDINQFAVEVSARAQSGAKQFDIRLDPPELGRVDVRLSIDASGNAEAHLTADQPSTLDLLQKDASVLARALRDAGLNLAQDGLNFSLKNQSQGGGEESSRGQQARTPPQAQAQTQEHKPAEASAYLRRSLGLLDIKV